MARHTKDLEDCLGPTEKLFTKSWQAQRFEDDFSSIAKAVDLRTAVSMLSELRGGGQTQGYISRNWPITYPE